MNRDVTIREMFLSWLSGRVLSGQLSDFEKTSDLISEYCERSHILEKPFFETTDPEVLSSITQIISQDWDFRRRVALDFDKCSALIKFYIVFLKANKLTIKNEEQAESLKTNYIIQSSCVSNIENEFGKDKTVNDVGRMKLIQDCDVEAQEQLDDIFTPESESKKFAEWMMDQGMKIETIRAYLTALEHVQGVSLNNELHIDDIFLVSEPAIVVKILQQLKNDREIRLINKHQYHSLRLALNKYCTYCAQKSQEISTEWNSCESLCNSKSLEEMEPTEKNLNAKFTNQHGFQMIPQKNFSVKNLVRSEYYDYIYYAICRQDLMTKRAILQEKHQKIDEAREVLKKSISDKDKAEGRMRSLNDQTIRISNQVVELKDRIDSLKSEIVISQKELAETSLFFFGRKRDLRDKIRMAEDQLLEEENKKDRLVLEQKKIEGNHFHGWSK